MYVKLIIICDSCEFLENKYRSCCTCSNISCEKMDNENDQLCQLDVPEEHNINGDVSFDDEPFSAPVEVLSEFLSTLMARNYKSALYYCKLILQYEPENEVVQDFYPLIQEKLHSDITYDSDGNTDENMSTLSEASTEYFTSTSVASANTSICSSFSSDEEEISADLSE